ncbi:MAG: hypothetical protein UHW86_11575 [Spirochaetota bacterium]|nr:hypothetical protein [Spirochaetota bacterium]
MQHITLTDNKISSFSDDELHNKIHVYYDIQSVAGKTLSELCNENSSLLVFPHSLDEHRNGIEELSICELSGRPIYNDENQIINVDDVKIKTGNLMGFIGFSGKQNHGTKLEIRSRFTNNDKQDYFFHYMLEKVFKINLFDMNYSHSKNNGFDLLYLIFPALLKRAFRQGIFRTYRTFHKNDAAVKGVIEISRHIKYNEPFNGKIAYRSREYSADNDMTQLIRHTIEFIKQKSIGKNVLNADAATKEAVNQIIAATDSSYCFQNRSKIIHRNIKPVIHPYFSEYKYLQKLCLLILSHQSMQYAKSDSPVYGILFDGAWLWEEYLNTILQDLNFEHPTNKDRKGGIRLFDNTAGSGEETFNKCYRRIYPDFYRENTKPGNDDFLKNDGVILDAKYKQLEKGLVQDDLYQIISYMHTMKIPTGGFIYPLPFSSTVLTDRSSATLTDRSDEDETLLPSEVKTRLLSDVEVKKYHLAGLGGTVSAIGFPILQNVESYSDFSETMKKSESNLLEKMRQNKL